MFVRRRVDPVVVARAAHVPVALVAPVPPWVVVPWVAGLAVVAGYLLDAGLTLPVVAAVMSLGTLVGAVLLYRLPKRS